MHGCSLASVLLVNAEVDSMGGVFEGRGSVGIGASPRQAAVEVQAELRQEYDVREERRRELEFLEMGGNPLDFKFGNFASFSLQSTLLTDQHLEFEAKASFAFTGSPHGDSVESSGRPGAPCACEPNSADNLMLFSGENDSIDGDRVSAYHSRNNATLTEHSFQLDGNQNTKETRDTSAFGIARKAYRRRDRSQPTRDGARSNSSDVLPSRGVNGISVPSFHGPRVFKGLVSDIDKQEQKVSSNGDFISKRASMATLCEKMASDSLQDAELDIVKAVKSTDDPIQGGPPDNARDADAMENINDHQQKLDFVLDVHRSPVERSSEQSESFRAQEVLVAEGLESQPSVPISLVENQATSGQMKGFSSVDRDFKSSQNSVKIVDLESSGTQTILSLDGNNDTENCTNRRKGDTNGNIEPTCILDGNESVQVGLIVKEKKEIRPDGNFTYLDDRKEDGLVLKAGEGFNATTSDWEKEMENQNRNQGEVKDQNIFESMDVDGAYGSEMERKTNVSLVDDVIPKVEVVCLLGPRGSTSNVANLPETALPAGISTIAPATQTLSANLVVSKADEDFILEEARIIEAKFKMIAKFSESSSSMCYHKKSHWEFVLEEMAWLANDFAQERLWKITAASQVCRQVSSSSCLRFLEQNSHWGRKKVAHFLATAVVKFWHSLEQTSQEQKLQFCNKDFSDALRDYALRFQKHNDFEVLQAEAPVTPDRISDLQMWDMSSSDHLPEENIFYKVPLDAIEKCRKYIESHIKYENAESSIQEEVETSACDAVADNLLEEDEGETSTHDTSAAFTSCKSSRFSLKKRKISAKANGSKPYEEVVDSQFVQFMEKNVGSQQPFFLGKCPASSLNVSFPTKRVRTSNRHRVLSPFSVGTSACAQVPTKTDASSGDTSSFHDDLSTLHDGSHVLNNFEVESVGDFGKQLLYDSAEVSTKSKKKKKAKDMGSAYEQRWQVDSNFQSDQRDLSRKRLNRHQFESKGLFGQHIAKKQNILKQSIDNSFDSSAQVGGFAPSPVASQISSPNKLGKYFGGRDRGRKNKGLKMPGQPVSGNGGLWSLFEDQALVVLVHDLGPNWDLISDAVNSILQFKCIFRNPKECKERHKQLMDRSAGDGADCAEDSGSSQPYSSTLPGIPEGSARQLFQRLQGPMEEDTLKSHFDKIVMLGQKLHFWRKQALHYHLKLETKVSRRGLNDNQEPKQTQPPHGSHMNALTQVCPNNLSGGPILMPLDLCEEAASSPDVLPLGHQGSHSAGLPFYNQGTMTPILAVSGANSPISGSSNMIMGNNFPSSSNLVNASVRDGRHVPRSTSLAIEEEQRMQQNNQMLPARNFAQSNISSPRSLQVNDWGVCMLPVGNGAPFTNGINRNFGIARPGFQENASSSVLNSGYVMSSEVVAMPSTANIYTGVASGQGNSLRPRDAKHMLRPTQNQDHQQQFMVPALQMQGSQGTNQGIPPFGVQISSFPNQTANPPLSAYALHYQQPHPVSPQQSHEVSPHRPHLQGTNHASNPQHQAYGMFFAKRKPLQQQIFQQQQQQQQFASANSMMPHAPPHTQLPLLSPLQNSSQIAQPPSTVPASLSPFTSGSPMTAVPQDQQQQRTLPRGVGQHVQTANCSINKQIGKQRRQPQEQQFPECQKKQQQTHSQQQVKVATAVGRGHTTMNNTTSIEPSIPNGFSTNPGYPSATKGEQTIRLLQVQGLHSGSPMYHIPSGSSLVPHSSD